MATIHTYVCKVLIMLVARHQTTYKHIAQRVLQYNNCRCGMCEYCFSRIHQHRQSVAGPAPGLVWAWPGAGGGGCDGVARCRQAAVVCVARCCVLGCSVSYTSYYPRSYGCVHPQYVTLLHWLPLSRYYDYHYCIIL